MIFRTRRIVAALASTLPALAIITGCGGQGTNTTCTLNSCTVTFDRGVDAQASILGIKAELVGVQGNQVTLRIAGQEVTVPVNSEQETDGFNVSVQSVTTDNVVVNISRSGVG